MNSPKYSAKTRRREKMRDNLQYSYRHRQAKLFA
jgi:hypothetical protein